MQLFILSAIISTAFLSKEKELTTFNHDVKTIDYEGWRKNEKQHSNSFVYFSNAKDLNPNESFSWMHNNGEAQAQDYTDVPMAHGVLARFNRVWKTTEIGDIGLSSVTFDLSEYGFVESADLKLLIDTDKDGFFSDELPQVGIISGAKFSGNDHYTFSEVNMEDGQLFTLATSEIKVSTLKFEQIKIKLKFENEIATIEWKTNKEINCKHYEVEKSGDGKLWEVLSKANGSGNSSGLNSYLELDYEPYYGNTYYRLKQVDHDNNFVYSKKLSILNTKRSKKITIQNESSTQTLKLILEGAQINLIELYDEKHTLVKANTNLYWNMAEIDMTELKSGVYDAILTTKDNQKISRKLIKR